MKTIQQVCLFILFTFSVYSAQSQSIEVSGDIASNTTWYQDSIFMVGDVHVLPNVVLTINPGTYVESQGYHRLQVSGSILAIGSIGDSIIFTVNNTAGFWQDTTSVTGGWGGIVLSNSISSSDSSVFNCCRFQYGKKCDGYNDDVLGGAICARNYHSLTIKNSLFFSNQVICPENGIYGSKGGAIYCDSVNEVVIDSNWFQQNRSFDSGGAIAIKEQCGVTISNNTFYRNRAIRYKFTSIGLVVHGVGGAIYTSDALGLSPKIYNNYCFNNQTTNGTIYMSNRNGLIFNNVICNNYGSGILDGHQLSTTHIFNNTIVNNQSWGGGIEIFSKAIIYNNICWGNQYSHGQQRSQIYIYDAFADCQLFNNCVEYGMSGEQGIYDEPQFVDASLGFGLVYDGMMADWSLSILSPCINSGTADTAGLFIPDIDIQGQTRILGNRIEMGAIENQYIFVGFEENETAEAVLTIFPNPGTDQLFIECDCEEGDFEMYSSTGQLVALQHVTGDIRHVVTGSLPSGMYSYRLLDGDHQTIGSGKWIRK